MAIRNIRYDGDEILRKVCKPVKEMNERTLTLIDDMFDTMYEANGVGLAAPQVGVLKRIVVIDIVETEGEQTGDEGCLSLPGKIGTVTRPMKVVCKAFNENMEEITITGEGLLARAICHETDHLDGILYKDKTVDGIFDVE